MANADGMTTNGLSLKDYQEEFCRDRIARAFSGDNVDWSALSVGLFADMGTGKTPATILLIEWTRQVLRAKGMEESAWPSLIVCPAAVKSNWKHEFTRFAPWVDQDRIIIIGGNAKKRKEQLKLIEEGKADYVITNYEVVRLHQRWFQDFPSFLAVVVDEAHAIKNREARRTVAIKSVNARFRLALTGTPITNKPDDLWSILHFVYPGTEYYMVPPRKKPEDKIRCRNASPIWGSYWSFTSHYCEWKQGRFGSRIVGGRNLGELHDKLVSTNSMVRWHRSEVLSLEPIIYKYVILEPTKAQWELYNLLANGFVQYLEETGKVTRKVIQTLLVQLIYFRRATTLTPREFALALGDQNPEFAPDLVVPVSDRGAKQEWLLNFLDNHLDGQKALIFSDWTDCTKPLVRRLEKHRIETVYIDGQTPHEARFDIQQRFNEDDTLQAFVGSPAAYEGLNLQGATYVVFMNLPWGPKDVYQAYSRAHRMGQEGQVTVIFPLIAHSIDERMADQLYRKQSDIDLAIDAGEVNAAKLFEITSKEQVLDMLGDRDLWSKLRL